MIEPSPLTTLVARAARLYVRRWPLFLLCAFLALAARIGIDATHLLDKRLLDLLGEILTLPALAAIVYAFVAFDVSPDASKMPSPWERIAERLWAVVVIDAITTVFSFVNPGSDMLLGFVYLTGYLILNALLVYADVHAVIEDGLSARTVVQQSVMASVRTALTRIGYGRAIAIVFLQIAFSYVGLLLDAAVGARVFGLETFASTALVALVAGPIAALTVTVYLELRQPSAK